MRFIWVLFFIAIYFAVVNGIDTTRKPVKEKMNGPKRTLLSKVVIGSDNRYQYNDPHYPWASVGKIVFGRNSGWMCTGMLIGPKHVLTNSHCVDSKYPIYFLPSYRNGINLVSIKSVQARCIANGTLTTDTSTGYAYSPNGFRFDNDWAILLLNERIGDTYGWLTVKRFDNSWLTVPDWIMLSYPNAGSLNSYGQYPLFQRSCRIMESSGLLLHDCDSNPGSSGASIFGFFGSSNYSIVALNNAEPSSRLNCAKYATNTCSNFAVNSNKFIDAVSKALLLYP